MNSLFQEIIKQFKTQFQKKFAPFMWILGRNRAVEVSNNDQPDDRRTDNKVRALIYIYIWFRAAIFCAVFYFWFAK